MRRILLLAVIVIGVSSMAAAQQGNLGIFVDPSGSSCRMTDSGEFNVYVVHVGAEGGAMGSSFRVAPSSGVTAVWIFESSAYTKTGVSQTGVTLSYNACETGTFVVLHMIYTGDGSTPACEQLQILPNPLDAEPTMVRVDDCAAQPQLIESGYSGYFGGDDQACSCAVPVVQRSWGAIKALYL